MPGSWRGDLKDHIAMLPTPAVRDYKGANSPEHLAKERGHHGQLPNRIAMLKTLSASGGEGCVMEVRKGVDGKYKMRDQVVHALGGKETGLQLQPSFVEWMMGYPPNWTAVD